MSKLSFHCEYENPEPDDLVLPVEIRKSNMALVTKALSSQSVKLEPGNYFVIAHLPSGQELSNQVTVGDQAEMLVKLMVDPGRGAEEYRQAAPYEKDVASMALDGSRDISDGMGGAPAVEIQARIFRGNLLSGHFELEPNPYGDIQSMSAPGPGAAELRVVAPPQTVLQVLQPGMPAVNVFLPAPTYGSCTVRLLLQQGAPVNIEVRLDNTLADTLLRFYASGLVTQASSMIDIGSPELLSENLLQSKMADPIAACVGAYTLIRMGSLEMLHNWTKNLMDFFPWLPDGAALYAEHMARTGEHEKAMAALRELPRRGLPYFTDGLSYASSRLRTYSQVENDSEEEPDKRASFQGAKALLSQINTYVTCSESTKPILSYSGLDPRKPDNQPLDASLEAYDGMDISLFFG